MTQMQKTCQRAMWWAFINGRNTLNMRFATWGDVKELLRDYCQPSLAEKRDMLADVKRLKTSRLNISSLILPLVGALYSPARGGIHTEGYTEPPE